MAKGKFGRHVKGRKGRKSGILVTDSRGRSEYVSVDGKRGSHRGPERGSRLALLFRSYEIRGD